METKVCLALGLVLLATAAAPPEDPSKKALGALQGVWALEGEIIAGRELGKGGGVRPRWSVKGDQLTADKDADLVLIKLDPTRKPKAIDLTVVKGKEKGR